MNIKLAIYSFEKPHLMLYNYNTEQIHLDSIERVLNSPSWNTINSCELLLEHDNKTYFYFKITDAYVYIITSSRILGSKIYRTLEEIDLYLQTHNNKSLNLHEKFFINSIDKIPSQDKVIIIEKQIKDVTDTMQQAITSTLDRQIKIENLDDKVGELLINSAQFEQSSGNLKKRIKCSNIKLWILGTFIFCVIIGLVLLVVLV